MSSVLRHLCRKPWVTALWLPLSVCPSWVVTVVSRFVPTSPIAPRHSSWGYTDCSSPFAVFASSSPQLGQVHHRRSSSPHPIWGRRSRQGQRWCWLCHSFNGLCRCRIRGQGYPGLERRERHRCANVRQPCCGSSWWRCSQEGDRKRYRVLFCACRTRSTLTAVQWIA